VVQAYLDDPLVVRTMTASLGAALLEAVPRTAARGAEVEVPLLMLHGEDDPLCPVDATRTFFAEVASPGSRMHLYPGLLHEIFNEPERESVYADLWRWVEELAG
jgi:alpha-beta hydrolase superfamily lysophospholipase